MIHIEQRLTKKIPGLTSFFINFDYHPDIVKHIKTLDLKIYDKNTKE